MPEAVVRANAFDQWFSQFTGVYNFLLVAVWGRRHRKALPYIRGPRVLEVSFGTGYLLSRYAGRFQTSGIDYNATYVEAARKKLKAMNIEADLREGDAHALPYPDASFETLINTDAFTLYQDPKRAMAEFFRVLVPGGRLILMEWDYPSNGNKLGRAWANLLRSLKTMPYVDFDTTLRGAGFLEYEDHAVGSLGLLHMYVATKPETATVDVAPPTAAHVNANGLQTGEHAPSR
ncbi:MAG: methyltransferase domain-containing protein [Polyangiales bacterium]